ncbi:MAG TPA: hypothetical protein VEJ18_14205 [Planctomycetota bacterium]|nr:hypothetical protein [Planctomycetota bacterium]
MRIGWSLLVLAILATGCRRREVIDVPEKQVASDIPRALAMEDLRKLLPTADYIAGTNPKETYKASEVKSVEVGDKEVRVLPVKEKYPVLTAAYAQMTEVKLEKVGRYYYARIFSTAQPEKGKDLLNFQWRNQEPAQQVVQLLEALRVKK